MSSISARLSSLWEVDLRALALFRIGISTLLLLDLFQSQGAWLARDIAYGAFLGLMLLGWRTPFSTAMAWGLLVLRLEPAMGMTSYGLKIVSSLLFFCMLLPLGERWSLDRYNACNQLHRSAGSYISVASMGLLIQLALIYFSAGVTKSTECWLIDGSALSATLHGPRGLAQTSSWLLPYPGLLRWSSRGVYLCEVFLPLLIFCPRYNAQIRMAIASIFICMHLGIAIFMKIGIFPYYCLFAWALLLPKQFWQPYFSNSQENVAYEQRGSFDLIAAAALAFVILTNFAQWFGIFGPKFYQALRLIGLSLGLDQQWVMFNNPCSGF